MPCELSWQFWAFPLSSQLLLKDVLGPLHNRSQQKWVEIKKITILYYFTIYDTMIRDQTMHDSRINYAFFCKRGNSLHRIEKLKGLKWVIQIGFIYVPLKLRAEKVKHNFFLVVRTLCHRHSLFVYRINLCDSQS